MDPTAGGLAEYIAGDPDGLGITVGMSPEEISVAVNSLTQQPMVVCAELDAWLLTQTVAAGTYAGWPIAAAIEAIDRLGPGAHPLWPVAWAVKDWLRKGAACASSVEPGLQAAYQWLDVGGDMWTTVVAALRAGGLLTDAQIASAQGLVAFRASAARVRWGREITIDEIRAVV